MDDPARRGLSQHVGVDRVAALDEVAADSFGQPDEALRQRALVLGFDVGGDERSNRLGSFGRDAPNGGGALLIAVGTRPEQQQERVVILGHPAEVGAEPHLGLFLAVGGAGDGLADGGAQPVAGLLEQRQGHYEQLADAAGAVEVLVEHRLGDTGSVGHVVHRGGVEAVAGEHLHRHIEDLLPSGGSGQPHAHVVGFMS